MTSDTKQGTTRGQNGKPGCRVDRHPGAVGSEPVRKSTAPRSPCFTSGTVVATAMGPVAIDNLQTGDLVLTRDNGYRPILWIGARHFDAAELAHYDELQPVVICKDALGPDTPSRDMTVSPHHRMLLTGARAQRFAAETEVLAAATELLALPGVFQSRQVSVTYFHLMFEDHEVIRADGCWTESFLPEADVLDNMSAAQREEILTIFPELASIEGIAAYTPARTCVGAEATGIAALAA